jgi:CheY-like chemotaxis protein
MRVLVIEDEPDVGATLREFLKELGHEPVMAGSAEAGLARLESARPDAIILDIDLPGLSGLEFLQLERVRAARLPIVAVSGVASESQALQCLQLGAFDFVGKPVPFDLLGEVLAYLEPHALRRQLEAGRGVPGWHRVHAAPADFPLRIVEHYGAEWRGQAIAVSPFGVTARADAEMATGHGARLVLDLPDGGRPLRVMSLLVEVQDDRHVFYFVNLAAEEFRRLAAYSRRHRAEHRSA